MRILNKIKSALSRNKDEWKVIGIDKVKGDYSVTTSYYLDGSVRDIIPRYRGRLHGQMIEKYPNGQIKTRGNYKDGQLHGAFVRFADNGEILRIAYYTEGKPDGIEKSWKEGTDIMLINRYWRMGELVEDYLAQEQGGAQ